MSPEIEIFLIISLSTIYYLGVGMTIMPRTMLINERIAGDPQNPNTESAFLDSTSIMLSTTATILFSKYFSSMGDYVGRRPVLCVACLFSILANMLWIKSNNSTDIYIASVVSGICDIYLYVGLSWICDTIPNKSERGRYVGAYIGTIAGLTFSIAIPVGAVLSSSRNVEIAYKVSILLYGIALIGLVLFPIEDTLGIIPRYQPIIATNEVNISPNLILQPSSPQGSPNKRQPQKRRLPSSWISFFIEHLPFSMQTMLLLSKQSTIPQDWINNFLIQSAMKVIRLIILQYFFVICNFGPLIVALCSLFVGFVAFITLPIFLSRYTTDSLIFTVVSGSSLGLLCLSIAGTTIDQNIARILCIIGILLIALSASWHPSFQTIITNQYPKDMMGAVTGVLAINTEFSYFPAYAISLLFPLSLSNRAGTEFIWHGACFFISVILCWITLIIHIRSHGLHVVKLTRANKILPTLPDDFRISINNNDDDNNNKNNNNNNSQFNEVFVEDVENNKLSQEMNLETKHSSNNSPESSDLIQHINSTPKFSRTTLLNVVRGKSSTSTINSDIKVSNDSTPEPQNLFLEEIG